MYKFFSMLYQSQIFFWSFISISSYSWTFNKLKAELKWKKTNAPFNETFEDIYWRSEKSEQKKDMNDQNIRYNYKHYLLIIIFFILSRPPLKKHLCNYLEKILFRF